MVKKAKKSCARNPRTSNNLKPCRKQQTSQQWGFLYWKIINLFLCTITPSEKMVFSYSAKRVKKPACEKNQYKLSELKILTESDETICILFTGLIQANTKKISFPLNTPKMWQKFHRVCFSNSAKETVLKIFIIFQKNEWLFCSQA